MDTDPTDDRKLEDLTVAELDALAEARRIDDYPASGRKADKVAALEQGPAPVEVVRLAPGGLSPTLARRADEERAHAAELAKRRAADRKARSAHAAVSDRTRAVAQRTAEREAEGSTEVARIIESRADRQE